MIRFEGDEVINEFNELFGTDGPTPAQMKWLIKVIKHCRGRCRSNVALKNYLSRSFANLKFTEVEREWKGRKYMALSITDRAKPTVQVEEDAGEDE